MRSYLGDTENIIYAVLAFTILAVRRLAHVCDPPALNLQLRQCPIARGFREQVHPRERALRRAVKKARPNLTDTEVNDLLLDKAKRITRRYTPRKFPHWRTVQRLTKQPNDLSLFDERAERRSLPRRHRRACVPL
jgi:hypothetical protein